VVEARENNSEPFTALHELRVLGLGSEVVLSGTIGAHRAWTDSIISALSMPWSVTPLVRREPPSDTGRPRVGPVMMQNSGPTGSSSRAASQGYISCQAQSSIIT
jgi:hypothetical protein